jgi:hypothetical protein
MASFHSAPHKTCSSCLDPKMNREVRILHGHALFLNYKSLAWHLPLNSAKACCQCQSLSFLIVDFQMDFRTTLALRSPHWVASHNLSPYFLDTTSDWQLRFLLWILVRSYVQTWLSPFIECQGYSKDTCCISFLGLLYKDAIKWQKFVVSQFWRLGV